MVSNKEEDALGKLDDHDCEIEFLQSDFRATRHSFCMQVVSICTDLEQQLEQFKKFLQLEPQTAATQTKYFQQYLKR